MLRAIVLPTANPRAEFIIAGDDFGLDPFGRSYREAPPGCRLAGALLSGCHGAPAHSPDARTGTAQSGGNQCVHRERNPGMQQAPAPAMAHGCVVTVREGSAAAAFVEPGRECVSRAGA